MAECRYCHCTDARACSGGCSWHKPGYCSACAEEHLKALVEAILGWLVGEDRDGMRRLVQSGHQYEISWRDRTPDVGFEIVLRDHLALSILRVEEDGALLLPHYDAPELMPLFATSDAVAA